MCYTGKSQCGSIPQNGNGFALANGSRQTLCVPTTWGGRLWARTGCNFTQNGKTTCAGSCQGQTVTVGPEWYPIAGRALLGMEAGPRLR